MLRLIAAALIAAAPAAAQEGCPWGGAVRRANQLHVDIFVKRFDDPVLFARIDGHPACDVTVEAVRQAARRPDCALYADRPDALGIEMALHCLLSETGDRPEAGTTVWISSAATAALLGGN
ncbi:MAG: hypothetical protein D6686_02070 [Alphaproteobacteria bacterium]|nr:MAG: hypothetical protein D6686_02070 [Alphaproteobacteria bacterium]